MEKKITVISGLVAVFIQLILAGFSVYLLYNNWGNVNEINTWVLPVIFIVISLILFGGYVVLQPNEAAVISFMGKYKGSLDTNGFLFVNPFYGASIWSLKVSNHAVAPLTVNEKDGVPIEIGAMVSWKVGDTYKAEYEVEDLEPYIENQFEISLRTLAKNHRYSELASEEKDFITDLTDKCSKAGVIILDAKITHLNYVPEIAAAMLQKQQATAMSEAKEIIVDNAVNIAQSAAKEISQMTPEQKGKFISDLIVVLCSERAVSPVVSV